jgi:hypothetical protein
MNTFEFNLGASVSIIVSGEFGQVIARAEYLDGENQFLVRYRAADGRAVEAWWNGSALVLKETGDE